MVFSEATLALPLIAGYIYHRRGWENRNYRRFADIYSRQPEAVR